MFIDIFTLLRFLKYQKRFKRIFFFENSFIEPHLAPYIYKNKDFNKTVIISFYRIEDKNLKKFQIFQFNKIFFLNFVFLLLKIKYCYSSTPDLDHSAFQRSVFKLTKYIYIQHSPLGLRKIYRDDAFTNFDLVQVINIFQKNDLNDISKIKKKKISPWRGKYLFLVKKNKYNFERRDYLEKKKKILIAPTWGTNFFDLNLHLIIKKNLDPNKYDLFLRPHIMSTKQKTNLIQDLVANNFKISSGKIDYTHFDLLITDWSGIYIEFAKIKNIKSILIQNEEKILNKKLIKYTNETIDSYARKKLGIIIKPEDLYKIENKIDNIFLNKQKHSSEINVFFKDYFY